MEYENCNPNNIRVEWPGGGFYRQQDNILISIWNIFRSEVNRIRDAK